LQVNEYISVLWTVRPDPPEGQVRLADEVLRLDHCSSFLLGWPHAGADRLIDVLWGDGQAAHPANALQVFRALATMEGTLTALAPGFDIVAEARRSPPGSSPRSSARTCCARPRPTS
jgi:hypothetical protein